MVNFVVTFKENLSKSILLSLRIGLIFILVVSGCADIDVPKGYETQHDTIVTAVENLDRSNLSRESAVETQYSEAASFLNLKLGINAAEYERLKDSLRRSGKLYRDKSGDRYKLQLLDNSDYKVFDGDRDSQPSKYWTALGLITPKFYNSSLMEIEVGFKSDKGGQIYGELEQILMDKYAGQKSAPAQFFSIQKQLDTIAIGSSMSWSMSNRWDVGDTFILLELNEVRKKISPTKFEITGITTLVYKSKSLQESFSDDNQKKDSDNLRKLKEDF